MTDNEINISIAEACGWKKREDGSLYFPGFGRVDAKVPDYCHDLNAMHEAEETLSTQQATDYSDWLLHNVESVSPGYCWSFDQLHAPSHKRAEAFLRAIGKWKE